MIHDGTIHHKKKVKTLFMMSFLRVFLIASLISVLRILQDVSACFTSHVEHFDTICVLFKLNLGA